MSESKQPCLVIHSVRRDGERFRPSDWAERLSAEAAFFSHDRRLRFDRRLKPAIVGGEKCLFVSGDLANSRPDLYDYITGFASKHDLRVETTSCQGEAA